MDIQEQTNEVCLLLEKLFASPEQTVKKEAEFRLNTFSNPQNDAFFTILAEIIISKNSKGFCLFLLLKKKYISHSRRAQGLCHCLLELCYQAKALLTRNLRHLVRENRKYDLRLFKRRKNHC